MKLYLSSLSPFQLIFQKLHFTAKIYCSHFYVNQLFCAYPKLHKKSNFLFVLLLKIWKNPLKSVHEIFCNAELCGILKIKRIISWNYDGIKNFHLAIPERIWLHFDKQSGTAGAASSLSRQEIKRTSFSNGVNDVDAQFKISRILYL